MGTWRRLTPDTRTATWLFLLLFGFFALVLLAGCIAYLFSRDRTD